MEMLHRLPPLSMKKCHLFRAMGEIRGDKTESMMQLRVKRDFFFYLRGIITVMKTTETEELIFGEIWEIWVGNLGTGK